MISYPRAAALDILYLIILEIWGIKLSLFLPSGAFTIKSRHWKLCRDLKIGFVNHDKKKKDKTDKAGLRREAKLGAFGNY